MAYTAYKYYLPGSNEYEIHWAGRYGEKGAKRAPKGEITPEQMRRQNQWRKEREARRTMKLNFVKGDLWCTLLYPAGTKKTIEEVASDVKKCIGKLRREYRKRGTELKYMIRYEIGSKGGIHIHILCNHLRGEPPGDVVIQEKWKHGRVHFERFGSEEEDYQKLSEYLVKGASEQQEQKLDKLPPAERKMLMKYSTSRNLIRPKPEKKEYKRRTVRSIVQDGPKPSPGYYIAHHSVITGINPWTGMSYIYYTEVKIDPGGTSP